ncbi:MAG: hypothetical protein ABW167_12710 [Baekduia sp.]
MTATRRIAGLLTAGVMLTLATAPGASAAPSSTANVRVEGGTSTLFEGLVTSSGNPVKAASDATQHRCDGTNLNANPSPGATATGAATEGLRLAAMDFDGKWFPGFDDYYITRLGPDAENLPTNVYWGILVNDTFTDIGGCQAQIHDGNRVLWAYDAFHERGFLKLAVTGDSGANPQPTTTVIAGQPVNVTVSRAYGEKNPNYVPVGGMTVAPVTTAANGAQTVDTGAPEAAVSSGIDGTAALVFTTPGWHRIKADGGVGGPIRSNRLDVCVVASAGGTCGAPPADTTPQQAPPLPPDPIGPPSAGPGGSANNANNNGGRSIGSAQGAPVIELPRFTAAGAKAGRITLSWKVLRPGVGVKSWSLAARPAGATSRAWAVRAHGTKGTSARLALAGGRSWTIRATFTDKLDRQVSEQVGDVLVPLDAGAKGVRRTGNWRRKADRKAWLGSVHEGHAGARLSTKLGAGKVVVLVRGVRRSADIEITAGGKRATYRVSGSATTATREIVTAARARAGAVTVRIVRGKAGVDGVGTRP